MTIGLAGLKAVGEQYSLDCLPQEILGEIGKFLGSSTSSFAQFFKTPFRSQFKSKLSKAFIEVIREEREFRCFGIYNVIQNNPFGWKRAITDRLQGAPPRPKEQFMTEVNELGELKEPVLGVQDPFFSQGLIVQNSRFIFYNGFLIYPWCDQIKIFHYQSPQSPKTLEGHKDHISSIQMLLKRPFLVSVSDDATIRIWDFLMRKCVHCLEGHKSKLTSFTISLDERFLVSGSYDKTIRIWDLKKAQLEHCLEGHQNPITCLAISGNNRYLVSGSQDEIGKVWNVQTGSLLQTFSVKVSLVAITYGGNRVALASCRGKIIRVWNRQANRFPLVIGHEEVVLSLKMSPNNKELICLANRSIQVWSLVTGECHPTLTHQDDVTAFAVSPDGYWIVSGSHDKTVRVWDQAGKLLRVLKGHTGAIESITFDAAGEFFCSRDCYGGVRIWCLYPRFA